MFVLDEGPHLEHYGIKHKSGRYPWGSGAKWGHAPNETEGERAGAFQQQLGKLREQGVPDTEIAKTFGMTTTELRNTITIANNVKKAENIATAEKLAAKGLSNASIAEAMGLKRSQESTVRSWLAPGAMERAKRLSDTYDFLKKRVDEDGLIDVGKGVEHDLKVSKTHLDTALGMLKADGYMVINDKEPTIGTNNETNLRILAKPGTRWQDVKKQHDQIKPLLGFRTDVSAKPEDIVPPISIHPDRVQVVFKEHGGENADGVIFVRPGVPDTSMGSNHYAQVRIKVGDGHYLKGMAVQKEGLPPGVDLQFHTNKSESVGKMGAMKKIKEGADPLNQFGANIREQIKGPDNKPTSVMNIVNDEAKWDEWSKNLAPQFLAKQSYDLIKSRLDATFEAKKAQFEEIKSLTNPAVKEKLLQSFADDMDSSSVHLKAAALPGQKTHVILPLQSIKEGEVYAPGYKNGTRLALVRFPHGGTFEIPNLVVNNGNREGKALIRPDATAAIGIHPNVAKKLSGADFDGDTVVAIPNNHGQITHTPSLKGLEAFDPQTRFPGKDEHGNPLPGVKFDKDGKLKINTQLEMGKISNLITDMTVKGANNDELAAAVRHSMVVIDAEKHGLNYWQSAKDNNIASLAKKYQAKEDGSGRAGGVSTLLSRTTHDIKVPDFKPQPIHWVDEHGNKIKTVGPVDPNTGQRLFVPTGKTYNKKVKGPNGEDVWVPHQKMRTVSLGEFRKDGSLLTDAHELSSGTHKESLYADHANRLKALANQARLEEMRTKPLEYSKSARIAYSKQVDSLNHKLMEAEKNAPLERQAQLIANAMVKIKRAEDPTLTGDELKKEQYRALKQARATTGADRHKVEIDAEEWAAIQAGAFHHSRLRRILEQANIDQVKELATPRSHTVMTPTATARAKSLKAAGYTLNEIAEDLGVSVSTLTRALKEKK